MKNLKSIMIRFLFIALCSIGAQVQAAGLFGWQTVILASDGATIYSQEVHGNTFFSCELRRTDAINTFTGLGYSILSDPHCTASLTHFEFPILIDKEKIPWKWPGPVCLSCPFLNIEAVNLIYPHNFERVNELIKEFNIDAYNKDLLYLQRQYDLQGFEEEMIKMEMEVEMKNFSLRNMDVSKWLIPQQK